MREGYRYYINITNNCNTECPFCCMYSSIKNKIFMSFDVYRQILEKYLTVPFELQLEGGEPLLHKDLYLFLEYAASKKNCKKIIILTNGIELEKHLKRLISFVKWYNIEFEIKVSVNYWLIGRDKNHIKKLSDLIFATEYIDNFYIKLNIRKRKEDEWIDDEIKNLKLDQYSNSYYLQSYGKFKDYDDYNKPVIDQNIENWGIYASDGKYFGQDLIARSEYEKELIDEYN